MKLWTAVLALCLCLVLTGCDSPKADSSLLPMENPFDNGEVMRQCGVLAGQAASALFQPKGVVTQTEVAHGKWGAYDVVVYRFDIGTQKNPTIGYIAVNPTLMETYFSPGNDIRKAVFYRVKTGDGSGETFAQTKDKISVTDLQLLEGVQTKGEPDFYYAIGKEGLLLLRDTTWIDLNQSKAKEEEALAFSRTMLSFMADARIPVTGGYSDPEFLAQAILDWQGKTENITLFEIACQIMQLDYPHYIEFIQVALPGEA